MWYYFTDLQTGQTTYMLLEISRIIDINTVEDFIKDTNEDLRQYSSRYQVDVAFIDGCANMEHRRLLSLLTPKARIVCHRFESQAAANEFYRGKCILRFYYFYIG